MYTERGRFIVRNGHTWLWSLANLKSSGWIGRLKTQNTDASVQIWSLSLCGKTNNKNLANRALLGGDPTSSTFRGFWVCKLSPVWELIEGLWFSVFKIQVRLCSIDLELFCLCRSSKIKDFLHISVLETPRSTSNVIVLCKSNYSDYCFDSAVHYGTISTFLLAVECYFLTHAAQNPITSIDTENNLMVAITFRFSNWVAAVSTVRSNEEKIQNFSTVFSFHHKLFLVVM